MIIVALLLPAIDAEAENEGTYVAYTCRGPAWAVQQPAPAADWSVTFPPKQVGDAFGAGCPSGPLWLDMSQDVAHPFDDYMHMTFTAPADTQIQDYVVWRSVQLADTFNYRIWEGYRDGSSSELDSCFPSRGCASKGSVGSPESAANKFCGGTICAHGRSDIASLMVSLTCGVASGSCAVASPGARFQLHRADIRLIDRQDPILTAAPSGPLVSSSGPVSGVQSISVSGSDRGGGVYEALVAIDGKLQRSTLDANGGLCRQPYMAAVPCKLSASGTIDVDTTRLPDGPHSVRVMVSDVAGNLSGASAPVEFRTANASCNPDPRVGGMAISAGVAAGSGRLRRVVTTRLGRRLRLRGRLLGANRQPVAGAAVCIAVRDDTAQGSARPVGDLTTDGKGRFAATLAPGPSRTVYAVHRVPGGAITASVQVRVRAPVRLRVSRRSLRNGQSVWLRGRLAARPRPGVLVELQARRDSGWQTFGTTRTGRGGRFAYPYQFTRTTSVQRYRMRARVPDQPSYPFAAGGSRPVTVTVKG